MEKEIEQIMIDISDWPLEDIEKLYSEIGEAIQEIKADANR